MSSDDSTTYTLGPYQLVNLIGEVRTSRLYLARHQDSELIVALRAITHPRAAAPEFHAAFVETMERITAMQAIDGIPHLHIAQVLHFAVEEGIPYIVTPRYVKGALSTWLAEHVPLNPQVALDIAVQVADALDHAHGQGIAHGDVRPANMLIADDGSIHLTGFGLADLFAEQVQVRDRTVTLVGSQYYMSPDVALIGHATPSGDVYALGVMLYEMLAGKRPFAEETSLKTLWAHARTPVPSLAEQRSDLPPDAVHWIEQALAKRPEDRIASAGELVAWTQAAITAAAAEDADAVSDANPHTRAEGRKETTERPDAAQEAPTSEVETEPLRS
jgi:serine/threonine-protein kinase